MKRLKCNLFSKDTKEKIKKKNKITNKTTSNIKSNNKKVSSKKINTNINANILAKAKNNEPIRVIYKKQGNTPEVKIISNVFKLKKAIVERNLSIIPYQTLYIVCNRKNLAAVIKPNIILDFYSIYGDLILVDIDKKKREFKSISQEDVAWYLEDLIKKSPNNNISNNEIKITNINENTNLSHNIPTSKSFNYYLERDFETTTKDFKSIIIDVLTNIELMLANLTKGDFKNE